MRHSLERNRGHTFDDNRNEDVDVVDRLADVTMIKSACSTRVSTHGTSRSECLSSMLMFFFYVSYSLLIASLLLPTDRRLGRTRMCVPEYLLLRCTPDCTRSLVNGRITVVGGEDDNGRPMDDVEVCVVRGNKRLIWFGPHGSSALSRWGSIVCP